jgi:hypothetical protein
MIRTLFELYVLAGGFTACYLVYHFTGMDHWTSEDE